MSEHTHAPHIDIYESNLPNQSFISWLKSQTALLISQFLGLISVAYVLTALIYYLKNFENSPEIFEPKNIQGFVIYAHIPFLLLFIVTLLNILDYNDPGSYRARIVFDRVFNKTLSGSHLRKGRAQLRKFKKYFLYFWILMLVLYLSFIFQINSQSASELPDKSQIVDKLQEINFSDDQQKITAKIQEIKTLLEKPKTAEILIKLQQTGNPSNLVRSMTIIQGINNSAEISKIRAELEKANALIYGKEKVADDLWGAIYYLRTEFFVFASNNLSLLFVFWCFTVLSVPWHSKKYIKREKLVRLNGTLIIVFITLCYPLVLSFIYEGNGIYYAERLRMYAVLADAVSGFINAVVLALLIARLDSKFIGLHSFLISILYGYSAVQALFAVFEQSGSDAQIIKAFVLIAVFIFKIYFFLIITYAMQTGRMLDYLICFPVLARRVDSIFANQFQIEVHEEEKEFKILIKRKNILYYSGKRYFRTIEECREGIKELRKAMENPRFYEPTESFGTYSVEVFDSIEHKHKICESIDLRSEEEAKELIADSIVNVPYCKVKFS
jgi:hypothetical protein